MTTVKHPLFARIYASLVVPGITRMGGDAFRERLLRGLSGTVLEVGAGEGSNFPHYPDAVTRVVAVEPEAYLRHRARERGSSHPRVEVVDGTAEALPVSEAAVDAVVFCLVLCSVEDQRRALREARRVLRPGGQIRLLEHVRAHEEGRMRGVQRALDATVWPLAFGGCHLSRDTAGAVEAAGFTFTELDRFHFPEGASGPESSAILGAAVPA